MSWWPGPSTWPAPDGGTLFLDEIGKMPLSLQAKLLRVLQERMFERLGGTRIIKVDVRIIAATNRSLAQCVEDGTFRADLYYRLNVVPVVLPPLRERREDIPLLLDHFLATSNRDNQRRMKLSGAVIRYLTDYSWPGNVRELQNLVERLVVMADGEQVGLDDLPAYLRTEPESLPLVATTEKELPSPAAPPASAGKSLLEMEREELLAALQRCGWVQARAARALAVGRVPPVLHVALDKLAPGATQQLLAGEPRRRMDQGHGVKSMKNRLSRCSGG